MGKHYYFIIFTIIACVTMPSQTTEAANSSSKTVMLQRCPNGNIEHNNEEEQEGTRAPSRPISCTLTQTTIYIPGIDINSILSFEVYSPEGTVLNVFNQQELFCNFIFTYPDELEIRLTSTDFILKGYL